MRADYLTQHPAPSRTSTAPRAPPESYGGTPWSSPGTRRHPGLQMWLREAAQPVRRGTSPLLSTPPTACLVHTPRDSHPQDFCQTQNNTSAVSFRLTFFFFFLK